MSASDFVKDPNAVLDFEFDWSQWLSAGEVITASTMFPSPGITLNSSAFASTNATAWLSGGTASNPYTLTNEITTSDGRTDERTITIRCQNR